MEHTKKLKCTLPNLVYKECLSLINSVRRIDRVTSFFYCYALLEQCKWLTSSAVLCHNLFNLFLVQSCLLSSWLIHALCAWTIKCFATISLFFKINFIATYCLFTWIYWNYTRSVGFETQLISISFVIVHVSVASIWQQTNKSFIITRSLTTMPIFRQNYKYFIRYMQSTTKFNYSSCARLSPQNLIRIR